MWGHTSKMWGYQHPFNVCWCPLVLEEMVRAYMWDKVIWSCWTHAWFYLNFILTALQNILLGRMSHFEPTNLFCIPLLCSTAVCSAASLITWLVGCKNICFVTSMQTNISQHELSHLLMNVGHYFTKRWRGEISSNSITAVNRAFLVHFMETSKMNKFCVYFDIFRFYMRQFQKSIMFLNIAPANKKFGRDEGKEKCSIKAFDSQSSCKQSWSPFCGD